jgi:methylated-DNA-[protein]-cysteine S-methyltransferase
MFSCVIDTPLGAMLAAGENEALKGLWFFGQKYFPQPAGKNSGPGAPPLNQIWPEKADYPVFAALREWLTAYFAGRPPLPMPALCPQGSAFRQEVWKQLLTVKWGETASYGELSRRLTIPGATPDHTPSLYARAVGGAVGHNPISILIPCHRIVGSDGRLTGYAGGLERKKALLAIEGIL